MSDERNCESNTHLRKRRSQSAYLYRRRMHRLTSDLQPETKFNGVKQVRTGPTARPLRHRS
jgi:hypothetical protein